MPTLLQAIFQPGYVATNKDIVHARRPTKDMHVYRFRINDFEIEINDVGGQKSELLKVVDFLNTFSSSTETSYNYILLVVPISAFDVEHEDFEGGSEGLERTFRLQSLCQKHEHGPKNLF